MYLNHGDYDAIMENNLLEQLNWLKSEFDFLFKFKKHKISQEDKKLARRIIDNFMDNINVIENERMLEILSDALETLEFDYPELF